ncbi:hypothetical protein M5689_022035 [Euphorbia peplus]|nr:hypothetical protein M5689_022035 [Euphorbia peplus]
MNKASFTSDELVKLNEVMNKTSFSTDEFVGVATTYVTHPEFPLACEFAIPLKLITHSKEIQVKRESKIEDPKEKGRRRVQQEGHKLDNQREIKENTLHLKHEISNLSELQKVVVALKREFKTSPSYKPTKL